MKVNIYDEENVQKGRLMLMNIAEDLKEYGKVKVSPMESDMKRDNNVAFQDAKDSSKKPHKVEDVKKGLEKQKKRDEMYTVDDDDFEDDDMDGRQNNVFMEIQSTVSFREIDIDKMLEHTTLDDFLKGLYVNSLGQTTEKKFLSEEEKLMNMFGQQQFAGNEGRDSQSTDQLGLKFDEEDRRVEMFKGENLRKQALQNLKEMRQRQKKSTIFGAGDSGSREASTEQAADEDGDIDDGTTASGASYDLVKQKKIDLTKTQLQQEGNEMDQ